MKSNDLMEYMSDPEAVLILSRRDLSTLLRHNGRQGLFSRARLVALEDIAPRFDERFLSKMKERFGFSYSFADKIRGFFTEMTPDASSNFEKAKELVGIFSEAIDSGEIIPTSLSSLSERRVLLMNGAVLPSWIEKNLSAVESGWFSPCATKPAFLCKTNTYEEYLDSVFRRIERLLEDGVSLNRIRLLNVSKKDFYHLRKWFADANIQFRKPSDEHLSDHPLSIRFLQIVERSGKDLGVDFLENLRKDLDPESASVANQIVSMINRYGFEDHFPETELLRYEFSKTTLKQLAESDGIRIESGLSMELEDSYNLILGYDDSRIPARHLDDDYLSDIEKMDLGIRSSVERNEIEHARVAQIVERIDHLFLFHLTEESGTKRSLPQLATNRELALVTSSDSGRLRHSPIRAKKQSKIAASKRGVADPLEYDPRYKKLDGRTLDRLFKNEVKISATSLQYYFSCGFRYLLSSLLRLDPFEETYPLFLGNLTHRILEKFNHGDGVDIPEETAESGSLFPEKHKWSAYRQILVKRLEELLDRIREIRSNSSFSPYASELNLRIPTDVDPRFVIVGKVDQIYKAVVDGRKYYTIIDYKTGTVKFNGNGIESGDEIQLLMYAYLYANSKQEPDEEPSGLYYQHAHVSGRRRSSDPLAEHSYDGLSLKNQTVLEKFSDFAYLKGVSLLKDGSFKENKRLIGPLDFDSLIRSTETLVKNTIKKILDGEFNIDPLPVFPGKTESESCQYCPHANICFMANHNRFVNEDPEEGETDGQEA